MRTANRNNAAHKKKKKKQPITRSFVYPKNSAHTEKIENVNELIG